MRLTPPMLVTNSNFRKALCTARARSPSAIIIRVVGYVVAVVIVVVVVRALRFARALQIERRDFEAGVENRPATVKRVLLARERFENLLWQRCRFQCHLLAVPRRASSAVGSRFWCDGRSPERSCSRAATIDSCHDGGVPSRGFWPRVPFGGYSEGPLRGLCPEWCRIASVTALVTRGALGAEVGVCGGSREHEWTGNLGASIPRKHPCKTHLRRRMCLHSCSHPGEELSEELGSAHACHIRGKSSHRQSSSLNTWTQRDMEQEQKRRLAEKAFQAYRCSS